MSDGPRYRLVPARLQRDPRWRALDKTSRYVVFTILTSRQLGRLPVSLFSLSAAAQDAMLPDREYRASFRAILKAFHWAYDQDAEHLLIPDWFAFNQPQNPSHLAAILRDLNELAPSVLVDRMAAEAGETLKTPGLKQAFADAMVTRGLPRVPLPVTPRVPTRAGHQELELELELELESELEHTQTTADDGLTTKKDGQKIHAFIKRFCELYQQQRNGAIYHVQRAKDVQIVRTLLDLYGADTLEAMAILLLTVADVWIATTDRGLGILSVKATWLAARVANAQTSPQNADWDQVLDVLRLNISTHDFHRWWKPTQGLGREGRSIIVAVTCAEHGSYLQRNYSDQLREAIAERGLDLDGVIFRVPTRFAFPSQPQTAG